MSEPSDAIPPTVAPPSEDFLAVHALVMIAAEYGWKDEHGFRVAMLLHSSGIAPGEAARLFEQSERWLQ
jgi:hypothetical protein